MSQEFCFRCERVTQSTQKDHASGTEWICLNCGNQVDFEHSDSDMDDYDCPVGSCCDCGTNLYEDDDPELCDQCLWARRPRL